MANKEIRKAARVADIPLWRIAAELGISEPTMTRWLRTELPEERRLQVLTAIEKLSKEVCE